MKRRVDERRSRGRFVLTETSHWAGASRDRPRVLHWRTAGGAEVDFVIEVPDRLLPVEVKVARRVTHTYGRHQAGTRGPTALAVGGIVPPLRSHGFGVCSGM